MGALCLYAQDVSDKSKPVSTETWGSFLPDLGGKIEISVGWGDQMSEIATWRHKPEAFGLLPETTVINVKENYSYSQHWFVEGKYNLKKWFAVGAMVDVGSVHWDNADYNGKGTYLHLNSRENFTNISVMPTMRFTYWNRPHFQMHSSLGVGLDINTGTEVDFRGKQTEVAPAFYFNPVGVKGMYGRYFVGLDFGALMAMKGITEIYMFGSRLISVSVGFKL